MEHLRYPNEAPSIVPPPSLGIGQPLVGSA